ncbi:general substrate transporter [Gymnopus androsaceus JB14]|uniref:General substrate transporter n=1 Tax=Gymnopus androsaceus JB14 TaxID=1447944 RepID=A0A6A4H440_9AGAR|nr:general substrate transporter [Gymnopus androsaceus JB14]
MSGAQLIPGGLLALGAPFLSGSPRWLVSRDRNDDAVKSLSKIRNLPADHPYLMEVLKLPLHTKRVSLVLEFLDLFALCSSLFAWQNATGINAINYYSPTIFKSISVTGMHASLLTTGVYGIIKLLGALF